MPINRDSDQTKHIITGHNHWVNYRNGRGGLHAYTYCGWVYIDDQMEGAYGYGGWWRNPRIPHICSLCVHVATCTVSTPEDCEGCREVDAEEELGHPIDREEGQ